jgi:polysaccharide export outer membrane protein
MTGKLPLRLTFLLLLYLLGASVSTTAQEYVINPGDTISILVWGHEQYTQTISVRPDGRISYPFLGEVKVGGLTTTELSEKIRKELLKHLINPQVTVAVTQPKKNEVFVLGQVKFPNQFRFEQDRLSLLKALSMAGGVLDEVADMHNLKIIRDDGTSEIVDLEELLSPEPQRFIFLYTGDVVYVPGKERVSVTGHVMKPGEYKTRSSLGVMQALALAGGPIEDTADLSKALIIRSTGKITEVDLSDGFRTDKVQDNPHALDPGDALYVPYAYEAKRVNVLGYVREPGQFQVKGSITILESLALAGGISSIRDADLQQTRIIRGNGMFEQIDLSALEKPAPKDIISISNIMLEPGDTLEIHQKRKLINWSLALTVVSVLSLVYNMAYNILK